MSELHAIDTAKRMASLQIKSHENHSGHIMKVRYPLAHNLRGLQHEFSKPRLFKTK